MFNRTTAGFLIPPATVFSPITRSLHSIADKDVLGKNVAKIRRSRLGDIAYTIAGHSIRRLLIFTTSLTTTFGLLVASIAWRDLPIAHQVTTGPTIFLFLSIMTTGINTNRKTRILILYTENQQNLYAADDNSLIDVLRLSNRLPTVQRSWTSPPPSLSLPARILSPHKSHHCQPIPPLNPQTLESFHPTR